MERLNRPDFDVIQVLTHVHDGSQDIAQQTRIANSIAAASNQANALTNTMAVSTPDQYASSDSCAHLPKEEVLKIYKDQMSSERGSARRFYNGILGLATNDRCPMCRVGVVTTVDHYLPKSRYIDVALAPITLVPCCRDCNFYKGVRYPRAANDHFMHPYFDDFSAHAWLQCSPVCTPRLTVSFHVNSNNSYGIDGEERLRRHFERLRLNRLFTANAMNQLIVERDNFRMMGPGIAPNMVSDSLQRSFDLHQEQSRNSWQSALYRALLQDPVYINGGWANV